MSRFSDLFRTQSADQSSGRSEVLPPSDLLWEEETPLHHIRVDLASQVISLDIDKDFPDYRGNIPIPSLLDLVAPRGIPAALRLEFISASLLGQKAKQFDDGVVAAIALGIQQGLPEIGSKPEFLEDLVTGLLHQTLHKDEGVLPLLMAAAQLGGANLKVPVEWQSQVDRTLGDFLNNPYQSKPIAFYTWSDPLTNIFRQDRLLQTPISAKDSASLASFLQSRPDQQRQYEKLLMLGERLTNYYVEPDLRNPALFVPDSQVAAALFPSCASPEVSLLERLYPPMALPVGFSLIDEVINHIRSGELSLAPRANSGWYEYQLWSLEPLVIPEQTPEAAHLRYEKGYKDHLTELFKGMYALARETHVKDLRLGAIKMAMKPETQPILVSPHLTVEPLPTSYRRRALGYRFLHDALREIVGEDVLGRLHRVREARPVTINLTEELTQMEALFWGAYLVSMHELGFPAHIEPTSPDAPAFTDDFCWKHFHSWQDHLAEDEDMAQDCRMMVPVFYDLQRRQMKVWVFLGWREAWIKASFAQNPKVEVLKVSRDSTGEVRFVPRTYRAVQPVMREVYVSELLNRDEFRSHCTIYRTEGAILKNLPGASQQSPAQA